MTTKRVNFNLDEDLYIKLKHLALDKRTTVTDLLTEWIIREVERDTNQTKLEIEWKKIIVKIELNSIRSLIDNGNIY